MAAVGCEVAKEIELEDPIENTAVALLRQAASKTNDAARDGITTAVALAQAMGKEGLQNLLAGDNFIALKRGMEKAENYFVEQIKAKACPVEDSTVIA